MREGRFMTDEAFRALARDGKELQKETQSEDEIFLQRLKDHFPSLCKSLSYIECLSGWYELIHRTLTKLQSMIEYFDLEKVDVQITQIKEKWGYLRIYLDKNFEAADWLLHEAEQESSKTCEICGNSGCRVVEPYNIKTLCINCKEDRG